MTSRERLRRAIHFEGPDRLPPFLPDEGPNDLVWLWPKALGPKQDWGNDGDKDWMTNEWGALCYRAASGKYGFGEVFKAPIEDITRQAEDVHHEPAKIAAACRAFRKYERLGEGRSAL
jgi:hypothetical protein